MADLQHGISGYRRGCRCETCRAGKRESMRAYRARRRQREAAAAAPAELAAPAPLSPPLISSPAIDLQAMAGTIESAFEADLTDEAEDVLWPKTLIAMARLNARVMDQVARHERLDLIPSVQLRTLEILNRLAYIKLGQKTPGGSPSPSSVGVDAEALLRQIAEGTGGPHPS